jgi:LysR family hydrogen peroxide-inducible transcriptional activator
MTVQQWQYVLSVIDEGSFSRAAAACFVTQPTLSIQIAKLEDELGLPLIDRLSRPLRAAPGAVDIIDRARTSLQLLGTIPELASERASDFRGRFSIGIIPTLSQYLLPRFLREFIDDHPGIHLEISELQSADILHGVRNFRLDLGILALPAEGEALVRRRLFYEEFLVYLPPGGGYRERIDITGLDRREMLLLAEGHCLRDQIVDFCGFSEERRSSRIKFETGSLESLISLVDQGLGYTLLPELAALGLSEDRKRRCRPLAPAAPVREIGAVHHPATARPLLASAVADAIVSSLPEKVRGNGSAHCIPWQAARLTPPS